jgi:predicted CoA-binding protein
MMNNSRSIIQKFLSLKTIAVVGVSRNKDKFGNMIFRELRSKGYKVLAVNPNADMVEGERCYPGLGALPEKPDGVVLVIPPQETLNLIHEAAQLGIEYIWLQQGANSLKGEELCKEMNLKFVSGECIFMYLDPVESIHAFHRFFKRLFGKMPK